MEKKHTQIFHQQPKAFFKNLKSLLCVDLINVVYITAYIFSDQHGVAHFE